MQNQELVNIKNLKFSYSQNPFFENVTLNFKQNEVVVLLGRNGSGKSTFLKLLTGELRTQAGSVKICDTHAGEFSAKYLISICPQDLEFPAKLKVEEVLRFVSDQYKSSYDIKLVMEDFELDYFKDKYCSELSGGMKRRLALACAIVGKQKVLLLDEPTTGLDQKSKDIFFNNIKKYQKINPFLVIIVTHQPEDIADFASFYLFFKNGKIQRLETEQIKSFSNLKKVTFLSNENISFPEQKYFDKKNDFYEVIVDNLDDLIKKIASVNFYNFKVDTTDILENIERFGN